MTSDSSQGAAETRTGLSLPELHARRVAAAQAAFLLPHLRSGVSLLDCGCGPGTITLGLAEAVAPGHVTGIDLDPRRVEEAKEVAAARGSANVGFQVADIYDLPFRDESFDAAFENTVLMHLREPERALREIRRILKPGGVIGVRDANADGHLFLNASEAMDQSLEPVLAWQRSRGMDIFAGRRVASLLREAGFHDVVGSASYDSYGTPEAVRQAAEQHARRIETVVAEHAIEHGLADRATMDRMAAAWREWGAHPDSFWGAAHGEAVGWKR